MVGHDRKYWVAALPNLSNITILQYYNITILQYWEAAALPNHYRKANVDTNVTNANILYDGMLLFP